jgi:parallel beta-helix repeat protein
MTASATKRLVFLLGFLFAGLPGIALGDSGSRIVDCARGQSIQDALGKKDPDRPLTVVIRGACAEDLTLTRDDVTLVGEGGTVQGAIAILGARRVVIQRLTVTATGVGITGTDNASFTVEDSTIERNGSDGIQVRHGAHAKILRNRIADNGQASLPDSGRGIHVHHSGSAEVRNNTVLNNRSDGVGVFNGSYVHLVENTIEGNGRIAAQEAGVQVSRARIRAHGNTIRNNTGSFGIEIVNGGSYRTGSFLTAADFPDNEFAFEVIEHVGAGRLRST